MTSWMPVRGSLRRSENFRALRLPKFLGYFERLLKDNPAGGEWLVGNAVSYVDLSMFQVLAGLHYAFPKLMARLMKEHPKLAALHGRVQQLPRIKAYLASPRRMAYTQHGLFRNYPELDDK